MKLKKLLAILAAAALVFTMTACDGSTDDPTPNSGTPTGGNSSPASTDAGGGDPTPESFDTNKEIQLVTRAVGSGTRSAIVYLAKITDADGNDAICENAEAHQSTNGVLSAVESNVHAIGYVSLGSRGNAKVLNIDGVEPTVANIENESYKLQRPFNVTRQENLNDAAQDFWNFLFSTQGLNFIEGRGFVVPAAMKEAAEDWESNDAAGTIIVGGSTSVQPLMEEIKEEYVKLGGTVEVDIQGQGSGEGETMVVSGTYQIGMVSREVRVDTIQHETLAIDGIAVIVNSANPITNITLDDLKEVFLGNFEK